MQQTGEAYVEMAKEEAEQQSCGEAQAVVRQKKMANTNREETEMNFMSRMMCADSGSRCFFIWRCFKNPFPPPSSSSSSSYSESLGFFNWLSSIFFK
ncbi:hypothetical protein PIB30_057051 [Stylosanthes scabra]|uniref:Uncharacterized protein n=1 Tax=Stylosanthes scabra TaxID=79078 RepID=A0ABU6XKU7_9FABA|nr:hypothetical protein [Stylosanthes scabra]